MFMTLIEQRERTRQINEEKSKFPSTTYPTLFLETKPDVQKNENRKFARNLS